MSVLRMKVSWDPGEEDPDSEILPDRGPCRAVLHTPSLGPEADISKDLRLLFVSEEQL